MRGIFFKKALRSANKCTHTTNRRDGFLNKMTIRKGKRWEICNRHKYLDVPPGCQILGEVFQKRNKARDDKQKTERTERLTSFQGERLDHCRHDCCLLETGERERKRERDCVCVYRSCSIRERVGERKRDWEWFDLPPSSY